MNNKYYDYDLVFETLKVQQDFENVYLNDFNEDFEMIDLVCLIYREMEFLGANKIIEIAQDEEDDTYMLLSNKRRLYFSEVA